jgi:hypothetical protein
VPTDDERIETSRRVRALVVDAVDAATELIGRAVVAARWDEPSALAGMTVGALCAHLVRAAGATLAYLDRTPPSAEPTAALLAPVTYFHAAIDSPIHEQIKDVSADEARAGHAEVTTRCREVAASMRTRFAAEPTDRLVGALGGRMLTLDDFCRTRLIEVLLHVDDVAASIGVEPPAAPAESVTIVVDTLAGIARMVHGDRAVLHALARAERADAAVFPVL